MSRRPIIADPAHVENIVRVWNAGGAVCVTAGRLWYPAAYDTAADMAHRHGVTVAQAAGVIAAFSPRTGWDANIETAELCLSQWARGIAPADAKRRSGAGLGMTDRIKAAAAVLSTETPLDVLGGDKVRAFYQNIMGEPEPVTVDGHAYNIAVHGLTRYGIPKAKSLSGAAYNCMAQSYREAAAIIGVTPAQCQAGTWEYYRTLPIV